VRQVAGDRWGIGYSGIGFGTAGVRAVPLAAKPGGPFVDAVIENAHSGVYPLSRFLWLYVNREPGAPLDPARREFLLYVFSRQGQAEVVKDGYCPLTPKLAREQLAKVGL
jgi:phosphate transport system substrate-binding protein